ncbi:hypothetical protein [Paenibacillus sp. UNC496MF]|uniref:hypothetical protein n=1 Tax=Paenibacillus sp. UNC496MF TaxID=1502753 RepID=UPI001C434456|nr:hypothetical protein [Paenibacillus sp. UNC496MF]
MVVGALAGELKTIVSWVSYPLHLFAVEWRPSEKSPDFIKGLYAGVCLLLYLYLLQGCIQLFFWGVHTWKGSKESTEHQSLQDDLLVTSYSEEIASTIELIDHPDVSDDQVQIALDDLMKESEEVYRRVFRPWITGTYGIVS